MKRTFNIRGLADNEEVSIKVKIDTKESEILESKSTSSMKAVNDIKKRLFNLLMDYGFYFEQVKISN